MSRYPEKGYSLKKGEADERFPVDSRNNAVKTGLFNALLAQSEIGIGAFMECHKGWAEGQIHDSRGEECAEKIPPKTIGILRRRQEPRTHHADDGI